MSDGDRTPGNSYDGVSRTVAVAAPQSVADTVMVLPLGSSKRSLVRMS